MCTILYIYSASLSRSVSTRLKPIYSMQKHPNKSFPILLEDWLWIGPLAEHHPVYLEYLPVIFYEYQQKIKPTQKYKMNRCYIHLLINYGNLQIDTTQESRHILGPQGTSELKYRYQNDDYPDIGFCPRIFELSVIKFFNLNSFSKTIIAGHVKANKSYSHIKRTNNLRHISCLHNLWNQPDQRYLNTKRQCL